VRTLALGYARFDHCYVLNDQALLLPDMAVKTFFITHSERDWRFLGNLWEAYRILRRERPRVLLSAGARPAMPFARIGYLFGCPIVFVAYYGVRY
jgi:UDP-N-acetylglucosamine:LPS N-acetylglucosamine transferase